jgi:hypothetical protein
MCSEYTHYETVYYTSGGKTTKSIHDFCPISWSSYEEISYYKVSYFDRDGDEYHTIVAVWRLCRSWPGRASRKGVKTQRSGQKKEGCLPTDSWGRRRSAGVPCGCVREPGSLTLPFRMGCMFFSTSSKKTYTPPEWSSTRLRAVFPVCKRERAAG